MAFNIHTETSDFREGERVVFRPATGWNPGRSNSGGYAIQDGALRWSAETMAFGRMARVSSKPYSSGVSIQFEDGGLHYVVGAHELRKPWMAETERFELGADVIPATIAEQLQAPAHAA